MSMDHHILRAIAAGGLVWIGVKFLASENPMMENWV